MTRIQKWSILRTLPANLSDETWFKLVKLLDNLVIDFIPKNRIKIL